MSKNNSLKKKKRLHVKYKPYQHCIQINRTELFYICHNTFVNQQEHKNEYLDHGIGSDVLQRL